MANNIFSNLELIKIIESATELFKNKKYYGKDHVEKYIGYNIHKSGFYGQQIGSQLVGLKPSKLNFNSDQDIELVIEGFVELAKEPVNAGAGAITYSGYGLLEIADSVVYDGRGGSFTLLNGSGTTANGDGVDLGGALIENTTIDGATAYSLTLDNLTSYTAQTDQNATNKATTQFQPGLVASAAVLGAATSSIQQIGASITLQSNGTTATSTLTLNDGISTFSATDFNLTLDSATDTATFTDNTASPAGIQYAADYLANYTDRSLVDKGFTISQIGGQDVNTLIKAPTIAEDDHFVTWQNGAGEYDLKKLSDIYTTDDLPEGVTNKYDTGFAGERTDLTWYQEAYGSDLVTYLSTSITGGLYQETTDLVPVTKSTSDADPVGLFYDQSINALIGVSTNSRAPLLGSDGTKSSFVTYDGVDDRTELLNTAQLLKPLHGTSPTGTIAFKIKMGAGTDGTNQWFLNSGAETTANYGILIRRNTSNQVLVGATYGSPGNTCYNYTSTATLTEADGWQTIVIELRGTGGAGGTIHMKGVSESFAITAGADADATADLLIASNLTGTTTYSFSFDDLLILNRGVTAGELTTIQAINYDRASIGCACNLEWFLDFGDSTTMFSDAGKTTPVTDGDVVRAIVSKAPTNYGGVSREATAVSDATAPIYRPNEWNNLGSAEWDGVDDNLTLNYNLLEEIGGSYTCFFVLKNTDNVLGSNFMKGSLYLVLTGKDYIGNDTSNNGDPYFVCHAAGDVGASNTLPRDGEEYVIICLRRDGSNITSYTSLGIKSSFTTATELRLNKIGEEFNPGWWLDGYFQQIRKYRGVLSEREIYAIFNEISDSAYHIDSLQPSTQVSTATLTPDVDTSNLETVTALAVNLTIAAPTGTPVDGQKLVIKIKDDGTSRTLTWNAIFQVIGTTLPTATTISKWHRIELEYNTTDTKWDVVDVKEEV